MDWTSIVGTLVSCGFVFTCYELIKYRRENKRIKEAEARKKEAEAYDVENDNEREDIEIQREKMNLADDYMKRVLSLTEIQGGKMDTILASVNEVKKEVGNVVAYLNGGYQDWLRKQGR